MDRILVTLFSLIIGVSAVGFVFYAVANYITSTLQPIIGG